MAWEKAKTRNLSAFSKVGILEGTANEFSLYLHPCVLLAPGSF